MQANSKNIVEARQMRCCGPEGCGYNNDGERFCIEASCFGWVWDRYKTGHCGLVHITE